MFSMSKAKSIITQHGWLNKFRKKSRWCSSAKKIQDTFEITFYQLIYSSKGHQRRRIERNYNSSWLNFLHNFILAYIENFMQPILITKFYSDVYQISIHDINQGKDIVQSRKEDSIIVISEIEHFIEKKMNSNLSILTSSRLINSLLNVKPGITPRSRNQNIDANEPLKKIPSTQANATKRSANGVFSFIQRIAQSAFFFT